MILKLIFWYIIVVVSITVCNGKKPNLLKNGIPTTIERYPFVVSIQWRTVHICTGSLLTPRHALTTAHCVLLEASHILSNFRIVAGTSDRFNRSAQARSVSSIAYHSDYMPRQLWKNDLAILTTVSPFVFNLHTRAINIRAIPGFDRCTLKSAGWNNFADNYDNFQEIRLKKKRNDECTLDQLDVSQGCARILRNGYTTNGDSGCPLVFNHELVGIISTAFVERKDLVIYIDLWNYIRWIRNIIFAY